MFKKIAVVGVVLGVVIVGAVLAFAATRPGSLHVQRVTIIKAPREKIFPLINDFHRWGAWSPYEHKDPDMKRTFSGAGSGRGSIYEWAGNSNVGSGRMEIVESSLPSKVAIQLDFLKPFEGHNIATFTLEPAGGATNVTWVMDGPTPFVG